MVAAPSTFCLDAAGERFPRDVACVNVLENACKDVRNSLVNNKANKLFCLGALQKLTCSSRFLFLFLKFFTNVVFDEGLGVSKGGSAYPVFPISGSSMFPYMKPAHLARLFNMLTATI